MLWAKSEPGTLSVSDLKIDMSHASFCISTQPAVVRSGQGSPENPISLN